MIRIVCLLYGGAISFIFVWYGITCFMVAIFYSCGNGFIHFGDGSFVGTVRRGGHVGHFDIGGYDRDITVMIVIH